MKRAIALILCVASLLALCACGKANSSNRQTIDDSSVIVWEGRTYVPYCSVFKNTSCGNQIGIVDGDKNNKLYEYKGYSTEEWIVNAYDSKIMDGAVLYKEINVTEIPEEIEAEYAGDN